MGEPVAVEVAIEAAGWADWPGAEARLGQAIHEAARLAGVTLRPGAEVSLLLSDDATIRALNHSWRRQDKPTNVLSFPAVAPSRLPDAPLLGDIAIAYETVQREAADDGKSLADHATHLAVHGFLHLIGHDHETDDEAEAMEALERRILAALGVADPYAERA
jgi:probable rRNA maturation factor